MGCEPIVVPIYLAVENDRRSARRLWLARHLQFFGRDWLETFACADRTRAICGKTAGDNTAEQPVGQDNFSLRV